MSKYISENDIRKAVEFLDKKAKKPTMVKCACCDNMVSVYTLRPAPGVTKEQIDALPPILCEEHEEEAVCE